MGVLFVHNNSQRFPITVNVHKKVLLNVTNILYANLMDRKIIKNNRDVARIFLRRGGGGSHWVKQYRHGVFATEYCRLFA